MTELASIFQAVQIGVESVPGTSVAANKKLQSLGISPAIKLDAQKFRPAGRKFATVVAPGKEWVIAGVEGAATYTELVYPLSSLFHYAAPVQQGATTAYLWTFNIDPDGPDTGKTFTVERGSSVRAHKFSYGQFTGLDLTFSRGGIEVGGEMLGNALADDITMTAAPTAIALVPILPIHVDVYLADTQAGLAAASPLSRAISASWSLGSRFLPIFPLATAAGSGFAATVEGEPDAKCKLKMAADDEGMALLTSMRAGSSKFMRILATGDNIESTYDYYLKIDAALKVAEEPSEFSDEDGLFAIEWNFDMVEDATWTKATQIDLMTTVTAL